MAYTFIDAKTPTIEYGDDYNLLISLLDLDFIRLDENGNYVQDPTGRAKFIETIKRCETYGIPFFIETTKIYTRSTGYADGYLKIMLPGNPYRVRAQYGLQALAETIQNELPYGDICVSSETDGYYNYLRFWPCAFDNATGAFDAADAYTNAGYTSYYAFTFNDGLYSGLPCAYVHQSHSYVRSVGNTISVVGFPGTWGFNNVWDDEYGFRTSSGSLINSGGTWNYTDYVYNTVLRSTIYVLKGGELKMIDALGTGFLNAYELDNTSINNISSLLWSQNFITNYRKAQADPMDSIRKLFVLPFSSTGVSVSGVSVGNNDIPVSGSCKRITTQFQGVNVGSITIPRPHNNYLDFNGQTEVSIFIPFIGWKTLDPNDVLGYTITLVYIIDIISGDFVALVYSTAVSGPLYSFPGTMGYELEFSNGSLMGKYLAGVKMAVGTGTALVGLNTGNLPMVAGGIGAYTAGIVSKQLEVTHGGNLSGSGYYADIGDSQFMYTPRILIRTAIDETPAGYAESYGQLYYEYGQLSNFSGFTSCVDPHITGIEATKEELDEIEKLLVEGVFL